MAKTKNRPPCPVCESVKQRTVTSGWANDQTIPVTYVKCLDCGYLGHQYTDWLPSTASLNALDEDRRAYLRILQRQRRNALPQVRPLVHTRGQRISSDRLDIRVRIIRGAVTAQLAKRLATLRAKQPVVVPETLGPKRCELCNHPVRSGRWCNPCLTKEASA